jgi:hypothetical protein
VETKPCSEALPNPLHFAVVWVVGLHTHDAASREYAYGVAQPTLDDGNALTFIIRLAADFDSWTATRIQ